MALAEATDEGRKLVDRVEAERPRLFAEVLRHWERNDVEHFVALIERFNADLTKHFEGPRANHPHWHWNPRAAG